MREELLYYLGELDGKMPIGILQTLYEQLGLEFIYNYDSETVSAFAQYVDVVIR